MNTKLVPWALVALVGLAAGIVVACGPDKPPLTPDAIDGDAGAVPDMPAPPGSGSAAPTAVPPG
jgi:hypothetical protein